MMFVALAAVAVLCVVAALVAYAGVTARRAERLVPPAGRFVTIDGVRLHYLDQGADAGDDPTILMIHGLASQLQTFSYAMSSRLPGHRLVLLDRPGAGYSQAGPEATLTAQAALVAGFLQRLGIERAVVVGHSLGGAVALALAVDHPQRVAGLALIAPASQPEKTPPEAVRGLAVRSPLARWLIGWTLAVPIGQLTRDRVLATLFAPDPVAPEFAIRGGHALNARPWTFRNAASDLVEAGQQLDAYAARHGEIAVPVGILFGTGDKVLAPDLHGAVLARAIPGATLDLVEGGHMLPLAHPDRSVALVERVVAQTAALLAATGPTV